MLCIQIDVKLIEKSKTLTDHIDRGITVEDIKTRINDEEHIHPDQQLLTFNGGLVQDNASYYNIQSRSTKHSLELLCKNFHRMFHCQCLVQ